MNQVILIGYLGAAADLAQSNGTAYARLSLATSHAYRDREGNRQERTDWHRIVAFNGLAHTLARLGKGDRVAVRGRLQTSTYEKDGERRTSVEVVAAEVTFLRIKGRGPQDGAPASEAGAPGPAGEDIPF